MSKKCKEIVMFYLSLLSPTLSSPCAQVPVTCFCTRLVLPFPDAKSCSSKHWADFRCFVKMEEPLWQFRSKDFIYRVHMHIPACYSQLRHPSLSCILKELSFCLKFVFFSARSCLWCVLQGTSGQVAKLAFWGRATLSFLQGQQNAAWVLDWTVCLFV